jgi:hypothetical protein
LDHHETALLPHHKLLPIDQSLTQYHLHHKAETTTILAKYLHCPDNAS